MRVRSSSLLPDPVAPMQMPWGPMPSWADSFRSSRTGAPRSSMPIGTRRKSPALRGRQVEATSISSTSATPSSSVTSGASTAPLSVELVRVRRRPASGRAITSSRAMSTGSGWMSVTAGSPLPGVSTVAVPSARVMREATDEGSFSRSSTRWMTVTPRSARSKAASMRGSGVAAPPSSSRKMTSRPGFVRRPARRAAAVAAARSRSSSRRRVRSSGRLGAMRRAARAPAGMSPAATWGSRSKPRHSSRTRSGRTAARWTSSGEWSAAI